MPPWVRRTAASPLRASGMNAPCGLHRNCTTAPRTPGDCRCLCAVDGRIRWMKRNGAAVSGCRSRAPIVRIEARARFLPAADPTLRNFINRGAWRVTQLFPCCGCGKPIVGVNLDVIFVAPLAADFRRSPPPPLVGCLITAPRGAGGIEVEATSSNLFRDATFGRKAANEASNFKESRAKALFTKGLADASFGNKATDLNKSMAVNVGNNVFRDATNYGREANWRHVAPLSDNTTASGLARGRQ